MKWNLESACEILTALEKKIADHNNSFDCHSLLKAPHDSKQNLSAQFSQARVWSYFCSALTFDKDDKHQPFRREGIKLRESTVHRRADNDGWKETDKLINATMKREGEYVLASDSLYDLFFLYRRSGITSQHYMQFCSGVNRISKTKNLPHYSTIRRRIWPFVISTLFVQSKIVQSSGIP